MAMDVVDFEIKGSEMQFVEVELDPGEAAVGEAGSMMFMDAGITMDTVFGDGSQQQGGIFGKLLGAGKRVVRTRFWVDPEICTGDHSCIRLSGCPSLTVKANEDPLRTDPVAYVNNDCVGCGLCGEVAHAAQLCPSFAQIDIIQNPSWWDRLRARVFARLLARMAPRARRQPAAVLPAE